MTDAEIIKSLETCAGEEGCGKCLLYRTLYFSNTNCIKKLGNAVLDLLNRQQAKIEELEAKHWGECMQIAHYDDELRQATGGEE